MDNGRLPDGAVHGIIAFTFATFLLTVALWPSASAPASALVTTPETGGSAIPLGGGNMVGKEPYFGPVTAQEVAAECKASEAGTARQTCYEVTLQALLLGRGANASFDALDVLGTVDPSISGQGHALAHDLGRYAFLAYGDIRTALANCSYKAFQGCFHGALQSYLEALPEVRGEHLEVCPAPDLYRQSTCVHGIGHGLMLNTNANVNRSLELCSLLDDYNAQSCWSGVFMENLVGFSEMQSGAQHNHGAHTGPPGYMVTKEGDPYFPCSVVADAYKATCWQQMVDYILHFNGSKFEDAAEKCDKAPSEYVKTCRQRIGTDSHGWYHDVARTLRDCSYGDPAYRPDCIRGMAADAVLYAFSARAGVDTCKQVPEADKEPCYSEVGAQGRGIEGDGIGAICDEADPAYVQTCRSSAGV